MLKTLMPVLMAITLLGSHAQLEAENEALKESTKEKNIKPKKEVVREFKRSLNVPSEIDTSFKAYMDYRCITDISSKQYDMQQSAYTGNNGVRMIGNDYCVALGTGYGAELGDRFEVSLDSGSKFTIVLSDIKADIHTDATNRYTPLSDGRANVIEFIVQDDAMPEMARTMGNLDYAPDGLFKGNIVSIKEL